MTAGNGLVSTAVCQALSHAWSKVKPSFSRRAMVMIHPRMSLPLGQVPVQGGSFSVNTGRSGES